METHVEIIKLSIAYTLAGAFVFTVIISCMSLLGWVKFAVQGQQKKLFGTLIVQLVIGCLGIVFDFLKVNPVAVQEGIREPLVAEIQSLELQKTETVNQLAEMRTDLTRLSTEKAGIEDQLALGQQRLEALTVEQTSLRANLDIARRQLSVATAEKDRLAADLTDSTAELAALEKKKMETAALLKELEKQLETTRTLLASEQRQTKDLRQQLVVSNQNYAVLKEKHDTTLRSLSPKVIEGLRYRGVIDGG